MTYINGQRKTLINCEILGKLFNFSKIPYLQNGNNNILYLTQLFMRIK